MSGFFENTAFFRQLPDEVKQKLKDCKTEKEAVDVLREEMMQIPDEIVETVAGGKDRGRNIYRPGMKK